MMSLPVENLCAEMDVVCLPDTIYSLLIEKYFGQSSSAAVAQTSALDEPSLIYNTSRNWKGFVINERCYYFTPTTWSLFSEQSITLDSIKVFNVNHLYWLPGELLESTILKMPNLEELSIKGTQVCTVVQLAKILQSCPKVRKLEFTYTEKNQEEIADGLKKENISLDSLTASFQKLTSLKLSTTVPDNKHDVNKDPWLLIIKLLSHCRDCTDLAIEITYIGKTLSPMDNYHEKIAHRITGQRVKEDIERDELPNLAWMRSLKSLVLVKLGPCGTSGAGSCIVSSLLQSFICRYLFPYCGDVSPRPLERLWIQGFEILCGLALMKYLSPGNLKSYLSGDCGDRDEKYESFLNLEHLNGKAGVSFFQPLPSLNKLKYVSGRCFDEDWVNKFCEAHPELEGLSVLYYPHHVKDALCKLPKLKSFSARQRPISKAFVEAMTEAYPMLEILELVTFSRINIPPDYQAILSAFRFPNLTFLSLRNNCQLLDGKALLPIIQGCPKLQIIHLITDNLDSELFSSNLELFLCSAANLRDFRLEWNHKEDVFPETAISILKALLKEAVQLERLVLIDAGSEKLPDWNHPPEFADFLVGFVANMTDMTCCCLTFNQLNPNLKKEITERVEKEIVIERPSLCFYLDRVIPEASDLGVPPIHYHQIVRPISYVMPRV